MLLTLIFTGLSFEYGHSQEMIISSDGVIQDRHVFPSGEWAAAAPESFGYSGKKLDEAKDYFEKIGGDAFFVVKSGYVIAAWGDYSKPIDGRSIRKSYLNGLLGIEYGAGNLHLDATLGDLGIDDKEGLTNDEKKASILNLLTSSSGVYHPAAFESEEQKGARPPRGSFKPGTFFYYNNWDFNTMGHIYTQISGNDIFRALEDKIARQTGMQDFDIKNTSYQSDNSSNYPAYLIKSSARDDARFGYLYLRKGKWKDRQIIPEEWVEMSFTPHVKTGKFYYYDYGFFWWIDSDRQQYFARGNSGQYIAVLPGEDMVIVFRADPGSILKKWVGRRVKPQESFLLIPRILRARVQ